MKARVPLHRSPGVRSWRASQTSWLAPSLRVLFLLRGLLAAQFHLVDVELGVDDGRGRGEAAECAVQTCDSSATEIACWIMSDILSKVKHLHSFKKLREVEPSASTATRAGGAPSGFRQLDVAPPPGGQR